MKFSATTKPLLQYGIILLLYLPVLLAPYAPLPSPVMGGSFLLITLAAAAGIIHDPAPYSINKIFWVFNLVFFGLVPTYQYRVQHMAWDQHFEQDTFLIANGVLLASFGVYALVRTLLRKRLSAKIYPEAAPPSQAFVDRYYFIGNIIFIGCCTALILMYGLDNLWLRRMADSAALQMNSTLFLLTDKPLRGAVMYFALLTILLYRQGRIRKAQLVWVLAATVIVNFPLALPRYLVATLYISLAIAAGFRILRNRHFFAYTLVLLILVVFPMWSITRLYVKDSAAHLSDPVTIYTGALSYGDFDPYTSLCRTIEYVELHGATHGRQALGVLLFFVPRSQWPSKPIGSGALVYEPIGVGFRNIASPYVAEGFINYGIEGSLLFAALLAIITALYDRYYQHYFNRGQQPFTFLYIFYPVAMIMVFFMQRGDLLSSFAYLAGFFVSGMVFHAVLRRSGSK